MNLRHLKLAIVPDVVLVADRQHFTLEYWKHQGVEEAEEVFNALVLVRTYPIACGMPGHKTNPGLHQIVGKKKHPDWTIPEADWMPEDQWGTVIKDGDPNNPIVSRWMLFNEEESEGIHGTYIETSLGSAASHGCIRMAVPDVEELYPKVPLGTLLFIK